MAYKVLLVTPVIFIAKSPAVSLIPDDLVTGSLLAL